MGEGAERRKIRSWDDQSLPIKWKFLTPIAWAPAFPLIRHGFRSYPTLRTKIVAAAIIVANFHGYWLISNPDLSDEALGIRR